jgi:hypothetical protein
MDEIRADETRATRYEDARQLSQVLTYSCCLGLRMRNSPQMSSRRKSKTPLCEHAAT